MPSNTPYFDRPHVLEARKKHWKNLPRRGSQSSFGFQQLQTLREEGFVAHEDAFFAERNPRILGCNRARRLAVTNGWPKPEYR